MKVEVNNLRLKYRNFLALDHITFTLSEKKIYGLLGRNGAGKTSLLSILASFQEQTDGTIHIDGETPFENAKIMQQVQLVYNRDYKEESETVKAMLEDAKRYRPNFDSEYASHLIERFNLPLDKQVKKLSKGMQSALNVTIGLASRVPITIFDEAYLGMDAPSREIFYQEVIQAQEQFPRMMIISTHLVSEMDYLFDEILILNRGKLVLQENYESLVSRGAAITGHEDEVDSFVRSYKQLHTQQLGKTKSVMILGELSDSERQDAVQSGLEVGPISLQDLFIHLTEEGK